MLERLNAEREIASCVRFVKPEIGDDAGCHGVHADAAVTIVELAKLLDSYRGGDLGRDFFGVQTHGSETLYAFFVIHHASREVIHIRMTRHPTAEWAAQQIVECCGWYRIEPGL